MRPAMRLAGLALAAGCPLALAAALPEPVEQRLLDLCRATSPVADPAQVGPEEAREAIEALRILLAAEPPAQAGSTAGPCLAKPRRERLLDALEAFVAYLKARSRAAQASGGAGFYSLGSLLGEPGGWNALEQALPEMLAPAVGELLPPQDLARFLDAAPGDPARPAAVLSLLGAFLATAGPQRAAWVLPYVQSLARLQSAAPAQRLLHELLLDPPLLLERPELQAIVLGGVAEFLAGLRSEGRTALRDEMLLEFNRSPVADEFRWSELLEGAAGVLERPSLGKDGAPVAPAAEAAGFRPESDPAAPILASVYSLPSTYISPEAGATFLRSLLQQLPAGREILVLTDFRRRQDLLSILGGLPERPRLTFLETYGRYYSPWPRDPFLFLTGGPGASALLFRPPLEQKRQDDSDLAHEIFRKLPEPLRLKLGLQGLIPSPFRFHNGQLLPWKGKLYLSVHALEEETLRRQAVGELPPADRSELAGALRYLDNARTVASELGRSWGLEPVFVHAFPTGGERPALESAVAVLRAGAGHDLDSYMALLEDSQGAQQAVVGSVSAGLELIDKLDSADWAALRPALELRGDLPDETMRSLLRDQTRSASARAFGVYLDQIALHLESLQAGRSVARLPLVVFPVQLLHDRDRMQHAEFLLTWTNLVLETRPGPAGPVRSVELFSQGLPSGDRQARELFERFGYACRFFPTLRGSIVFDGGYRCASNHLRASFEARRPPPP
jgi:hypothetical protein